MKKVTTKEFIESLRMGFTDKQIDKMVWRVRFWKVLGFFGIKPKLRVWTTDLGNGNKAYFVNRALKIDLEKLKKHFSEYAE